MNSLGWSRRESQAPVSTAPPSLLDRIQNLNPFGDGGYVRLPTTESNPGAPLPAPSRREEEEGWFARKSQVALLSSASTHTPPVILHRCPLLPRVDCAMSSILYTFSPPSTDARAARGSWPNQTTMLRG